MLIKKSFTLTLSFCQFYLAYLTKDADIEFNQSDIKILSITFVVSDKIYIDKKNYSL